MLTPGHGLQVLDRIVQVVTNNVVDYITGWDRTVGFLPHDPMEVLLSDPLIWLPGHFASLSPTWTTVLIRRAAQYSSVNKGKPLERKENGGPTCRSSIRSAELLAIRPRGQATGVRPLIAGPGFEVRTLLANKLEQSNTSRTIPLSDEGQTKVAERRVTGEANPERRSCYGSSTQWRRETTVERLGS